MASSWGSVAGRIRRWHLAVTPAVGLVAAVLVVVGTPEPSLVVVDSSTQLLLSVLVPASGVLLACDVARARGGREEALRAVVAAVVYAVTVALAGLVLCLVVVAVVPNAAFGGPGDVVAVALGGVAVQVTAQLVGTGLGFLIRRPLIAFAGTIVLPLGLWLLLGALGPVSWVRGWITPFGALTPLMSGSPTMRDVLAWIVVLLLWGGLLNFVGFLAARRGLRRPGRFGLSGR